METRRHIRQLVLAGVIGGLAALTTGSPASAGGCSNTVHNGGPSSVRQYVEQLPGSCGPTASGVGKRKTTLPKSVKQKIHREAGKDAALIEKIATEEAYGAPQDQRKATAKAKKSAKLRNKHESANKKINKLLTDSEDNSNPVAAAGGVITDGSDSRLIALVILMLGIAAVVLATAVYKRRSTR